MGILSVGQVYGDADLLANRNYTSTLTCTAADSFLYTMSKQDFMKFFKPDSDPWKYVRSQAIR